MPGLIVIRLHHADPKLVTLDTPPELAPTMGRFQPARYSPIRGGSYVMPIEQVENLTVFARFNGLAVSDERHTAPAGARIVGPPRPLPECSNCGQPAKRGREPTYCPACGKAWDPIEYVEEAASLTMVECPACQELQRPGFPNCMHCGQALPDDNPTTEHDADGEADQPTNPRTQLDDPLPLAVTLDELMEQQARRTPPAKP